MYDATEDASCSACTVAPSTRRALEGEENDLKPAPTCHRRRPTTATAWADVHRGCGDAEPVRRRRQPSPVSDVSSAMGYLRSLGKGFAGTPSEPA